MGGVPDVVSIPIPQARTKQDRGKGDKSVGDREGTASKKNRERKRRREVWIDEDDDYADY